MELALIQFSPRTSVPDNLESITDAIDAADSRTEHVQSVIVTDQGYSCIIPPAQTKSSKR